MIAEKKECKIIQTDTNTNAFVVEKDNRQIFRISFSNSIIRKFVPITEGFLLHFQCSSSIKNKFGNVCLVSHDGNILWWAERKRPDDCYVELNVINDKIIGYDGSYNCNIDIRTGKVRERDFVK